MEHLHHKNEEMDEKKYSRLISVLGYESMKKLLSCNVLVLGAGGVGAEVCKNLLLSGVRSLILVDDRIAEMKHLSSNSFLREDDVGKSIAEATCERLRTLNESASVQAIHGHFNENLLTNCSVLVSTIGTHLELIKLNEICRNKGVHFVLALSRSLSFCVFSDFGSSFTVTEPNEETSSTLMIESITLDCPATVSIAEDHKHFLEDGDSVLFSDINGMHELNDGNSRQVTVTGSSSFTIPDDTRQYENYVSGGYIHKLPRKKTMNFKTLQSSLLSPDFIPFESSKSKRHIQLHLAYTVVDSYLQTHGGNLPTDDQGMEELTSMCKMMLSNLNFMHSIPFHTIHEKNMHSLTEASADQSKEERNENDELKSYTNHILNEKELKLFVHGYSIELSPIVSMAGGIAAHEVIKACTGLSTPIHQWLYFDAFDSIKINNDMNDDINNDMNNDINIQMNKSINENKNENDSHNQSRYFSQLQFFGKDFQKKLSSQNWFVVGAGSIGCEVLKNLILMGIGCNNDNNNKNENKKKNKIGNDNYNDDDDDNEKHDVDDEENNGRGSIIITDSDVITKPNIPLQPLFRTCDVGLFKADVAARELRCMNPAANIQTHRFKFEFESEKDFNTSFFRPLSGVISAVDSSESRLYLDSRCVFFRKLMINGGKWSTKGCVQTFVPHASEMYASTRDPPDHKDPPICTVKNFPYSSDHTLKWALDNFSQLYVQRPNEVNSYLTNKAFLDQVVKQPPSVQLPMLNMLNESLAQRPLGFVDCIRWARLLFEELFSNSIKQLCFNFPSDMKTSAGSPFWGGSKKSPRPLHFDASDPLHLDFIISAANLQGKIYGLKGFYERAKFIPVLNSVEVQHFVPLEGVKIAVNDNELSQDKRQKSFGSTGAEDDNHATSSCQKILQDLPSPASLVGYRLTPIEFDIDDENSFCFEFVLSASNLRAKNYCIPLCDKLKVYTAAKVVPSLPTTGSVVAGLMCIEIFKLAQTKPLSSYSHTYFNLQHPLFVSAQPLDAVKYLVNTRHGKKLEWTLWDRFEMDGRGMTLQDLLNSFKTINGLEITMLSYGKSLLYAEFLQKKKLQDRLKLSLIDLVTTVSKTSVADNETHVNFSITCTDADDEDVEVPDVLVRIK